MNTIQFSCPGCHQHIEAPESMLGKLVDCPSCSKQFFATSSKTRSTPQALMDGRCPVCRAKLPLVPGQSGTCEHCGTAVFGTELEIRPPKAMKGMNAAQICALVLVVVAVVVFLAGLSASDNETLSYGIAAGSLIGCAFGLAILGELMRIRKAVEK